MSESRLERAARETKLRNAHGPEEHPFRRAMREIAGLPEDVSGEDLRLALWKIVSEPQAHSPGMSSGPAPSPVAMNAPVDLFPLRPAAGSPRADGSGNADAPSDFLSVVEPDNDDREESDDFYPEDSPEPEEDPNDPNSRAARIARNAVLFGRRFRP